MADGTTEQIIKEVLDRLFTNGAKEKADRLVLVQEVRSGAAHISGAKDLGGYSRFAVRDILLDALERER